MDEYCQYCYHYQHNVFITQEHQCLRRFCCFSIPLKLPSFVFVTLNPSLLVCIICGFPHRLFFLTSRILLHLQHQKHQENAKTSWGWAVPSSSLARSCSWNWSWSWSLSLLARVGGGWWVGGWTKIKLMLFSTQVEVGIEVGVDIYLLNY